MGGAASAIRRQDFSQIRRIRIRHGYRDGTVYRARAQRGVHVREDFSAPRWIGFSRSILAYVRCIAPALKAPIELMAAHEPSQSTPYSLPTQAARYLEGIATSLRDSATIKCICVKGNPAERIVELAAGDPRTLIAMATHGYSAAKRWLLGSITEKVLHVAKNDLLVVRPAEGNPNSTGELKTMVVPLDGSQLAE